MKKLVKVFCVFGLILMCVISTAYAGTVVINGEEIDEDVYNEMMNDMMPVPENIDELLDKVKNIAEDTPTDEVIKLLDEIGFTLWDRNGNSAFFHLCKSGQLRHLQAAYDYCIENYGFNPVTCYYEEDALKTQKTQKGTPLLNAILSGRTENVKFVLEHGGHIFSNVVIFDENGGKVSPISSYAMIPMDHFDPNILSIMVANGADINDRGFFMGRTVIMNFISNYAAADKQKFIHPYTAVSICAYMIDQLGANIHLEDEAGYSPLKLAAVRRNTELAYMLGMRGGMETLPYKK